MGAVSLHGEAFCQVVSTSKHHREVVMASARGGISCSSCLRRN
jgi:hypothetical protein